MSVKQFSYLATAIAAVATVSSARASTLAYWTFDNGTAGTQVPHATAAGIFDGTTPDVSGNNNTLSTWDAGGAGYVYRADHATLSGAPANSGSIKNSGGFPAAMSIDRNNASGGGVNGLNTATFPQFTIEASYKPENSNSFRTVVGRDSRGTAVTAGSPDGDANLASLYLQVRADNSVGILYNDVAGFTHEAFTAPGFMTGGFTFGTDPEGALGTWYNLAGVSDGSLLTMYINGVQVAQTDLLAAGSTNTSLSAGVDTSTTDDWTSGGWTVGRGLYNGGHSDRAYGFIDDVRISDSAVPYSQLLSAVPEPTMLVAGIAALGVIIRRRDRRA